MSQLLDISIQQTNNVRLLLQYADSKYQYITYKKPTQNEENSEFWSLEETEEAAIKRVNTETEAYKSTEYQFGYAKIRKEKITLINNKVSTFFYFDVI